MVGNWDVINTAEKVKIIILNDVVLYPKNLILVSLSLMPIKILPIFDETINLQVRYDKISITAEQI